MEDQVMVMPLCQHHLLLHIFPLSLNVVVSDSSCSLCNWWYILQVFKIYLNVTSKNLLSHVTGFLIWGFLFSDLILCFVVTWNIPIAEKLKENLWPQVPHPSCPLFLYVFIPLYLLLHWGFRSFSHCIISNF